MSTAEIKKTKAGLKEWIDQLTDTNVLMALESLRQTSKGDWWDDLSDAQKAHIQEGLDDIEAGRVMTSKELWDSLNNTCAERNLLGTRQKRYTRYKILST